MVVAAGDRHVSAENGHLNFMGSSYTNVGVIVGVKAGCVVVQMSDGAEVLCRGLKDLHDKWGFFAVPLGQKVQISQPIEGNSRRPRLVGIIQE
jgi:hypothetical protein